VSGNSRASASIRVDRIRQIGPCRALMGGWFRLPCFRLPACDKDASGRTPLLASYVYRGHIIRFEAEQNLETLYWETRGVVELIEGKTSRSFIVNGAINTFKTEAEAKHALLQQAKRWIYDQIGS